MIASRCATTPPHIHALDRSDQAIKLDRLAIARNTLDLETLWVSEALLEEVAAHPMLEQVGSLREMGFDEDENLAL